MFRPTLLVLTSLLFACASEGGDTAATTSGANGSDGSGVGSDGGGTNGESASDGEASGGNTGGSETGTTSHGGGSSGGGPTTTSGGSGASTGSSEGGNTSQGGSSSGGGSTSGSGGGSDGGTTSGSASTSGEATTSSGGISGGQTGSSGGTGGSSTGTQTTIGSTGSRGSTGTTGAAGTTGAGPDTTGGLEPGNDPYCPPDDAFCGCDGVLPAFPGAQGGGAAAVGGRGGAVVEVTTLDDSGPGSLRAALSASGPRIVVFRVGGTIVLESALSIGNPYITVAGQTAPGGGIQISGVNIDSMPLFIGTHDVVVRYLRIRTGRGDSYSYGTGDVISMGEGTDTYNVVLDHCSLQWGNDENVALWADSGTARNLTVSHSVVSEALHHDEHSTGLIVGSNTMCEDIREISVHHNLFAHNNNRNPYTKVASQEIINNIVYNYGWLATQIAGGVQVDIVGNLYKEGVDTEGRSEIVWRSDHSGCNEGPDGDPSIYLQDNVGPHSSDPGADHWDTMMERTVGWSWPDGMKSQVSRSYERDQPMPPWTCPVTVHSVANLESLLLDDVGASHRLDELGQWVSNRDSVDARIVEEYNLGTGEIIMTEDDVGGFPTIASGTPYADDDHDGMADAWEQLHGLDPSDPSDGPADRDADGFTNVEEFLGGTTP